MEEGIIWRSVITTSCAREGKFYSVSLKGYCHHSKNYRSMQDQCTWAEMLKHCDAAWEAQMPDLVDAYLLWKHGSPNIQDSNDKFSIKIIRIDGTFDIFPVV